MAFQLRSEAEAYFKGVSGSPAFRSKFDQYYLCLMLGLASGRNERAIAAVDLVDYFIADYKPVGRLIVALLVVAEAHRLGVELSEKSELKTLLDDYLDATQPANITALAFQKMNDYANGGFIVLNEALPDRPRHVETFFQLYAKLLDDQMAKTTRWDSYRAALIAQAG